MTSDEQLVFSGLRWSSVQIVRRESASIEKVLYGHTGAFHVKSRELPKVKVVNPPRSQSAAAPPAFLRRGRRRERRAGFSRSPPPVMAGPGARPSGSILAQFSRDRFQRP